MSDLSGVGDPASKSDWGWGGYEPAIQALAGEALLVARSGGAEYADVRVVELEEERIYAVTGREVDWRSEHSYGVGVRVLRYGAWGFGSRALGDAEAGVNAAGAALLMAGNDDTAGGASLPPQPGHQGRYATPMIIDPFTVPAAEKEAILADMLATASSAPQVIRAVAGLNAKRQRRYFASTEDAWQVQELMECGGVYQVWARSGDEVQRRSYPDSFHGNTGAAGWEYVKSLHFGDEAHRVVDEACALLRAPTCPGGVQDVVIGPAMIALQIHESCGHAIELDRIFGDEAGFAGTSFITPDAIGQLRYGSPAISIVADPTVTEARGSFGFDDEGQPARRTTLVDQGVVSDFLSSRETASRIGRQSTATMRADGWGYIPLCFSTNVSLVPGEGDLAELLDQLGDGYYLDMDRSWSIDDRRLNFQFGTEIAFEVKRGRKGRLLKNASYGGMTPNFWGSVERVAGPSEFQIFGLPCGKGEPKQWGFVSHGTVPVLARGVQMGVAG